jgi:hypothetical protein
LVKGGVPDATGALSMTQPLDARQQHLTNGKRRWLYSHNTENE